MRPPEVLPRSPLASLQRLPQWGRRPHHRVSRLCIGSGNRNFSVDVAKRRCRSATLLRRDLRRAPPSPPPRRLCRGSSAWCARSRPGRQLPDDGPVRRRSRPANRFTGRYLSRPAPLPLPGGLQCPLRIEPPSPTTKQIASGSCVSHRSSGAIPMARRLTRRGHRRGRLCGCGLMRMRWRSRRRSVLGVPLMVEVI